MVNGFRLLREELRVRERADRAPHHSSPSLPAPRHARRFPAPRSSRVIHFRAREARRANRMAFQSERRRLIEVRPAESRVQGSRTVIHTVRPTDPPPPFSGSPDGVQNTACRRRARPLLHALGRRLTTVARNHGACTFPTPHVSRADARATSSTAFAPRRRAVRPAFSLRLSRREDLGFSRADGAGSARARRHARRQERADRADVVLRPPLRVTSASTRVQLASRAVPVRGSTASVLRLASRLREARR